MVIATTPVFSQSNPSATPEREDPYLLLMVLKHQDSLIKSIQKQPIGDQQVVFAMEQNTARSFNISVADSRAAHTIYLSLKAKIDVLDAQGRDYVRQAVAQGRVPDIEVLRGFDVKLRSTIQSATIEIQRGLSVAGWNSLRGYTDGEFRSHVAIRIPR